MSSSKLFQWRNKSPNFGLVRLVMKLNRSLKLSSLASKCKTGTEFGICFCPLRTRILKHGASFLLNIRFGDINRIFCRFSTDMVPDRVFLSMKPLIFLSQKFKRKYTILLLFFNGILAERDTYLIRVCVVAKNCKVISLIMSVANSCGFDDLFCLCFGKGELTDIYGFSVPNFSPRNVRRLIHASL